MPRTNAPDWTPGLWLRAICIPGVGHSGHPVVVLEDEAHATALYRRKVECLHEALADLAVRDEALVILRGLIEGVVMHPHEDGFTVELIGEIANMVSLALGPENNKAASGDPSRWPSSCASWTPPRTSRRSAAAT